MMIRRRDWDSPESMRARFGPREWIALASATFLILGTSMGGMAWVGNKYQEHDRAIVVGQEMAKQAVKEIGEVKSQMSDISKSLGEIKTQIAQLRPIQVNARTLEPKGTTQ